MITPPNPVYALGFNYDGDAGGTLKVTLSDGTTDTINAIYPAVDFFGVTSINPITSVELSTPSSSGSGQGILLTQFAYGPAAATGVPEPKSILLTLTMAVFLLLARRVRIRAKQC